MKEPKNINYEVEKSLKRMSDNQTPINIVIQIMAHNDHVGYAYIGALPITCNKGIYRVETANSRYDFSCFEARFENENLVITYDMGYKPQFAHFQHSSMA